MHPIIAIALGGSVGAVSRFLVANGIYGLLGRGFPTATLFINVSGSFLMGFLTELMLQRLTLAPEFRAAALIGFLGAYTTFSTFAIETLYLFEAGSLLKAFLNILLSVLLCLSACWLGLVWGRSLFSAALYPAISLQPPYIPTLSIFTTGFFMAALGEYFLQFSHGDTLRPALFVIVSSILTVWATLFLAGKPAAGGLNFSGLSGLFVINSLCSTVTVWLGFWVGNGLWQLKP